MSEIWGAVPASLDNRACPLCIKAYRVTSQNDILAAEDEAIFGDSPEEVESRVESKYNLHGYGSVLLKFSHYIYVYKNPIIDHQDLDQANSLFVNGGEEFLMNITPRNMSIRFPEHIIDKETGIYWVKASAFIVSIKKNKTTAKRLLSIASKAQADRDRYTKIKMRKYAFDLGKYVEQPDIQYFMSMFAEIILHALYGFRINVHKISIDEFYKLLLAVENKATRLKLYREKLVYSVDYSNYLTIKEIISFLGRRYKQVQDIDPNDKRIKYIEDFTADDPSKWTCKAILPEKKIPIAQYNKNIRIAKFLKRELSRAKRIHASRKETK